MLADLGVRSDGVLPCVTEGKKGCRLGEVGSSGGTLAVTEQTDKTMGRGMASKRVGLEGSGGKPTPASIMEEDESELQNDAEEQESPSAVAVLSRGRAKRSPPKSGLGKSRRRAAELIVLSSDDEEGEGCVTTQTLAPNRIARHMSPQPQRRLSELTQTDKMDPHTRKMDGLVWKNAREVRETEAQSEVAQALNEEWVSELAVAEIPCETPSTMELCFSTLHAGNLKMEANGNILITEDSITIPLKDGEVEVSVALVPTQLCRYGIWDGTVTWDGAPSRDTDVPAHSILFLWVSDAQARLVQMELSSVCPIERPGQSSPYLLLSLREPLDNLHQALLASVLDMMGLRSRRPSLREPMSRGQGLALFHSSDRDTQVVSRQVQDFAPSPDLQDQPHHSLGGPERGSAPSQESVIQPTRPDYALGHHRSRISSDALQPGTPWSRGMHQGPPRRLILFPPPPSKGGITVTTEDLQCLDSGEFLNDVIIDFYLKYLMLEKAPKVVAEKSHIFSSFFYRQLTRKDDDNGDDGGDDGKETGSVSAQHRRHQRVRRWTRHVDIFKKDYLFVPVNQEAHWYLVIVCFPWLEQPQYEERSSPAALLDTGLQGRSVSQATAQIMVDRGLNGTAKMKTTEGRTDIQERVGGLTERAGENSARGSLASSSPPECTQFGCHRKTVCKRPCILIVDSLKLSHHERIFKLIREYLQVEWEVRRGTPRKFTAQRIVGSQCRVPLQDNSSDCGIYLLQYAESFLQNPVVHFDLPLHLERWFPRQQVRRKRDEIRDLVLQLYRKQRGHWGGLGLGGSGGQQQVD